MVELDIICDTCGDGDTGAPQAIGGICDQCAEVEPTILEERSME